ncbi:MAG TPA: hypothetical protein VF653_18085, partial [Methylomirabilota bacterium]
MLEAFQIGDRALEDVAEDLHVHQPGPHARAIGSSRGVVVVLAEPVELGKDVVRHLQAVENGISGEQAAVVTGNVERAAALIDRPEETFERLPLRPRVVGVVVLEGFPQGFGGHQTAV